jgi:hypothetical protein
MEYIVAFKINSKVHLYSFKNKRNQKKFVKDLKKRKIDYVFTKEIK